jgi:hypothetical protein
MGKHGTEYDRVERDHYPTPSWVIDALAEHVELANRRIWECAAGDGRMARALVVHGARVFATDIKRHSSLDSAFDFLTPGFPDGLGRCDGIITNPAWGSGNRTAVAFIEAGLTRIAEAGGFLALLLPTDFDSAVTRLPLFQHPFFAGRIILTDRPVWFERTDGGCEAPKENCCWCLWARPALRAPAPPVVRYAVARAPKKNRVFDPQTDVRESVAEGFAMIRSRKAAGGPGWVAGGDTSRIVTIRRGEHEEWLVIHVDARIEHRRNRNYKARTEWIDLDRVRDFWPHLVTEVETALVELGAL